ncbi:Ig-like domain-containing protein [Pseudoduganella aquatica]|uniref:Big-1 domain-containing protein n=1 Tax=Pseudoduganella aquatica TaxID=2660641 RepID=A0A7X4HB18_9BURK|nr:Ig-like domain-containing protein [Pseudoduganella aquatica]MYN07022.1 hypothetical protein [Pseudoduganella aquatica]
MMKKFKDWLALSLCATLLAACGGGGGNPGSVGGGTGTPTTPGTPKVASVVLVSSADTIASSGADGTEVTLTVVVKDASNNVMADQTVDFKASSGAIAALAKTTDATGTVTARLSTKGDSSLRTITITATVGTVVSAEKKIQVVAGTPVQIPTMTLALFSSTGAASNSLSSIAPLTARATIKDKDGKPVPNALVSFNAAVSNSATLVAFSPSAGTTLTDANGVAEATVRPASLVASGAGTLNATAIVDGTGLTAQANFIVGATTVTLSKLTLSPATIGAYGSSVISVDVLAGSSKYTEQQMTINFSSACVTAGKATLAASAPTSNGTAQVVFRDQGCGNNDVITATLSSGASTPVAASAALAIASPAAASIQFVGASPVNQSIVVKGQGGFGRTETATLTFKVVDIFGKALPAQAVKFAASTPDVTVNKATDSTDANGEVIMTVNSGAKPTSFRVQATLVSNAAVSTSSDSIVVTTGLPVQQAFSLSVGSPNVEGWTYDSGTQVPATTVNVMVADQAGNPVADGLPVVFQSNLASVGASSKGACNTANGGCSVDFRTQNPRSAPANTPKTACNSPTVRSDGTSTSVGITNDSTRTGLATICASTTDGYNTLFAKIGIFLSGSFAENVWFNDTASPVPVRLTGAEYDLGTVGANDSRVFNLQLNDINNNPMPAGTRVDITNAVNASATGVSPASVQNVFAHIASGDASSGTGIDNASIRQGSYHTVTVGSVQPKPCLTPLNATFNVTITTPRNNVTTYPFKLRFSCP